MTVVSMFKIMLFWLSSWLNISLNLLRKLVNVVVIVPVSWLTVRYICFVGMSVFAVTPHVMLYQMFVTVMSLKSAGLAAPKRSGYNVTEERRFSGPEKGRCWSCMLWPWKGAFCSWVFLAAARWLRTGDAGRTRRVARDGLADRRCFASRVSFAAARRSQLAAPGACEGVVGGLRRSALLRAA
jgi:hypothetical protein